MTSGDILLFVLLALGALFVYFIPSWIAWDKPNSNTVMVVNLIFGWTLLGWFIALALAFWESETKVIVAQAPEDNLDKIKKLKKLLDSGAITEEEYKREKSKPLSDL